MATVYGMLTICEMYQMQKCATQCAHSGGAFGGPTRGIPWPR